MRRIPMDEYPEDLRDLNYQARENLLKMAEDYGYYSYGSPARFQAITEEQQKRLRFWDNYLEATV